MSTQAIAQPLSELKLNGATLPSEQELRGMTRRQLQATAKRFGVKANSKSDTIIQEIVSSNTNHQPVDQTASKANEASIVEVSTPKPHVEEEEQVMPVRKKKGIKTPYKMRDDAESSTGDDDSAVFRTQSIFIDNGEVLTVKMKVHTASTAAQKNPSSETTIESDDMATLTAGLSQLGLDDSKYWPWLVADEKDSANFLHCTLTGKRVKRDEAAVRKHMGSKAFKVLQSTKLCGVPSPKGKKTVFTDTGLEVTKSIKGWN